MKTVIHYIFIVSLCLSNIGTGYSAVHIDMVNSNMQYPQSVHTMHLDANDEKMSDADHLSHKSTKEHDYKALSQHDCCAELSELETSTACSDKGCCDDICASCSTDSYHSSVAIPIAFEYSTIGFDVDKTEFSARNPISLISNTFIPPIA